MSDRWQYNLASSPAPLSIKFRPLQSPGMVANTQDSRAQVQDLPHDSLGPTLLAILWSSAAVSAVILALRVYCKKKTGRGLWWDDYLVLGSWAFLGVEVGLVTYGVVRLDYGARDWDFPPGNFPTIMRMAAVSHPFILVSIIWSKTSFGVTLLRITTGWMKRAVWVLIISTNVFLGFSILIFYIQCRPIQAAWDMTVTGKCWSRDAVIGYHVFSGAWSAAVDLTFVFFPWKLLWGVQIAGREKLGIAVAMSMGIFAAVASIIKTCQLHLLSSGSFYAAIPIMYWGPLEAATTIVAASIPVLRVLVRDTYLSARSSHQTDEGTDAELRAAIRTPAVSTDRWRGDGSEKSILGAASRVVEMTEASGAQEDGGKDRDLVVRHVDAV